MIVIKLFDFVANTLLKKKGDCYRRLFNDFDGTN